MARSRSEKKFWVVQIDGLSGRSWRRWTIPKSPGSSIPGRRRQTVHILAMNLTRGVPIIDYRDLHALGSRERLDLIVRVWDARTHAHSRGVIACSTPSGNPTPRSPRRRGPTAALGGSCTRHTPQRCSWLPRAGRQPGRRRLPSRLSTGADRGVARAVDVDDRRIAQNFAVSQMPK